MHALQVGLLIEDSKFGKHRCRPVPDESVALSQELLAKLGTLPEDAQAVSHLLKQGQLPVLHGNFEALQDMTKKLVVGSSGRLATFSATKFRIVGCLMPQASLYSMLLTWPTHGSQVIHALLNFCFC